MLSYIDHVTECTKWRHTRPLPGEGGGKSKEHRTGSGGGAWGWASQRGEGGCHSSLGPVLARFVSANS